jgi:hypothetical protein
MMEMNEEDLVFLEEAYEFLENTSFVTKITDFVGKPIEIGMKSLPVSAQEKIASVSETALTSSLSMAHKTLMKVESGDDLKSKNKESLINRVGHDIATMATGAVGGFFGLPGLVIELPITTTLIMRSILSQGRSYGDMSEEELITNGLYVFSLGSLKSNDDDEMDSAYYSSRIAMDLAIKQASEYILKNTGKALLKNIEQGSAPIILELVTKIAQRFEIVVTEKMLAESLPIVGAIGGAGINLLFTDFFTQSAKYHFGLKGLELKYGLEVVQLEYQKFKDLKENK